MPEDCSRRHTRYIEASNGLEEETYELAPLLNESEMTSQHLGSFSSDGIAGSNFKLDIARCRSLESLMGRVAAAGYPQEVVLVQMNLKLRERLKYLCKCRDFGVVKPCNLQECPNMKQRLERHRKECPGTNKIFCKTNSIRIEERRSDVKIPTKVFMFDKCIQTTEVKRINDACTNWETCGLKQKMTSPNASYTNVCKRMCNSTSTMAATDCLMKACSTMAAADVLRHTQSCNTTVSFKNFYKDRLQYEVLQWLREVPIVAEFNSSTRVATEKTVNNLIDGIYKLSAKANCDTYECKLYTLVQACLEALPVSYHSVKCDKTKRVLIESLITRIIVLNNRYIFSTSNSSSNIPSFSPCGVNDFATYSSMEEINEAPITKAYRKDIHDWVHAKKFKRKDGKAVNKTDITERLLDRLFPLLYDKQTKNSKYLIRGGITETLNNYSLAATGSNDRLYFDNLANELATILLRTRSGIKPTKKCSSTVSSSFKNFFSNPKNFLQNLRKRNAVKINDSKDTPAANSKNFFRNGQDRRVTIASKEMTRCYSYNTSLKASDMWFKLVNTDFHELSIMCEITETLTKFIAFNSLYIALKMNNIKTLCQSDIPEPKLKTTWVAGKLCTEELALGVTYNLMLMCWITNEIIREYKIFLNYGLINKQIKSEPLGSYKQINNQSIKQMEELQIKILCMLVIKYGSVIIFSDAMTSKNHLAKSLTSYRKSTLLQYNTSVVF